MYIGHSALFKNTAYLSELARRMPDSVFSWIGAGDRKIENFVPLGTCRFDTPEGLAAIAAQDFLITVGRADANPTTILESMAWGLVPVCTPQSGYSGHPGIVNIPLDDPSAAVLILEALQSEDVNRLREMQSANSRLLEQHFNWDRFAEQVILAIEGTSRFPLGHASIGSKLAIASYTWASPYSPFVPASGKRVIVRRAERTVERSWGWDESRRNDAQSQ